MLADLLIFLAASGITVKLLDFYMSDGQKKWLNDRVLRMWDWLDRAKRVPLLDLARTPRSQRIIVAVAICAIILQYVAIWIWASGSEVRRSATFWTDLSIIWTAMALGAAIAGIWLGRRVVSMMLRGKTAFQLFVKASVMLVILLVPMLVAQRPMTIINFLSEFLGDALVFRLFIAVLFIVSIITIILWMLWFASVLLVLVIYVGSFLLYIVELTVRRIAEYPKGPVLAAGTLMGMVGALIKVFEAG